MIGGARPRQPDPGRFVVQNRWRFRPWRWGIRAIEAGILGASALLDGTVVCVSASIIAAIETYFILKPGAPGSGSAGPDWIAFSDRLEVSPDREIFLDQLVRLSLAPQSREDYAEAADRAFELSLVFKHEAWRILVSAEDWSRVSAWAIERKVGIQNSCERAL